MHNRVAHARLRVDDDDTGGSEAETARRVIADSDDPWHGDVLSGVEVVDRVDGGAVVVGAAVAVSSGAVALAPSRVFVRALFCVRVALPMTGAFLLPHTVLPHLQVALTKPFDGLAKGLSGQTLDRIHGQVLLDALLLLARNTLGLPPRGLAPDLVNPINNQRTARDCSRRMVI